MKELVNEAIAIIRQTSVYFKSIQAGTGVLVSGVSAAEYARLVGGPHRCCINAPILDNEDEIPPVIDPDAIRALKTQIPVFCPSASGPRGKFLNVLSEESRSQAEMSLRLGLPLMQLDMDVSRLVLKTELESSCEGPEIVQRAGAPAPQE